MIPEIPAAISDANGASSSVAEGLRPVDLFSPAPPVFVDCF